MRSQNLSDMNWITRKSEKLRAGLSEGTNRFIRMCLIFGRRRWLDNSFHNPAGKWLLFTRSGDEPHKTCDYRKSASLLDTTNLADRMPAFTVARLHLKINSFSPRSCRLFRLVRNEKVWMILCGGNSFQDYNMHVGQILFVVFSEILNKVGTGTSSERCNCSRSCSFRRILS